MRDAVSEDTVGVAGAKDSTTQCTKGALPHTRELHLTGLPFVFHVVNLHVRCGTSETCRSLSGQKCSPATRA